MKLQLEQINFIVGDLEGNYQKILAAYYNAKIKEVDLVVFSELALTGYFPEDLLNKKYFINEAQRKIKDLAEITKDQKTAILLGAPHSITDKHNKYSLFNSAYLIENGEVEAIIHKTTLPNYGVFDEKRYFASAITLSTINFRGLNLAILICEDIWDIKNAFLLASKNLDAIISINASPFSQRKPEKRIETVKKFIKDIKKPVLYVNQVGGQDSIIFDGGSFVMNGKGETVFSMKEFAEDSALIELIQNQIEIISGENIPNASLEERIYSAALLGLRDYIYKNNFEKIVLGMSGGIDSAVVATIAVDAIGSDKVKLVALPSRYNSKESLNDALKCSENLGVKLDIISIEAPFNAMLEALKDQFADRKPDTTEENLQSRIRGNLLMALSNKFGNLLLSTGNKSEMAVGYATIYGDMCGAFNPIKDIYKTEIYKIANWRNNNIPEISLYKKTNLIPQNIITKAPSAELRENQKDSDSLPEYDILDEILFNLIEEEKSAEEIIALGFDEKIVKKVARLFYNSEYKRRQAVIGPKISKMAFDKDRRYPITNKFTI